jgi:hypothetical protein
VSIGAVVDAYDVLGVSRHASGDEVKAAYRALAQIYHPDRYEGAPAAVRQQANIRMKQLTDAYRLVTAVAQSSSHTDVGDNRHQSPPARTQSPGQASSANAGSNHGPHEREKAPSTNHAALQCPACGTTVGPMASACSECGLVLDGDGPPAGSWMDPRAWPGRNAH